MTEHDLFEQGHLYEGRYLLPEDFDHDADLLLDRVQQAVDFILRLRVNALGMLDDVRNSVMLPAQEWEIKTADQAVGALRTEHQDFTYGGRPRGASAMALLERALTASETAVTARVEAWNVTRAMSPRAIRN